MGCDCCVGLLFMNEHEFRTLNTSKVISNDGRLPAIDSSSFAVFASWRAPLGAFIYSLIAVHWQISI